MPVMARIGIQIKCDQSDSAVFDTKLTIFQLLATKTTQAQCYCSAPIFKKYIKCSYYKQLKKNMLASGIFFCKPKAFIVLL